MSYPTANYYVTCHDTFMSGWGPAEGKKNVLIILCDTEDEATIVEDNARNRGDQKYIKIHDKFPRRIANNQGYFVQYKDKSDLPFWFKQNAYK